MDAPQVARALREACLLELRAIKPGNVHQQADGHGMTLADFARSAAVVENVFATANLGVGALILESIRQTVATVGCNTNLGIVLLSAPLAVAASRIGSHSLRHALRTVLQSLTVEDAALAYEAIRIANPAGLGESDDHDVRDPPKVTLLVAMTAAAQRDQIAGQYATDFAEVFDFGLPRLRKAEVRWHDPVWSASSLYLDFLSCFPDSHIERKLGASKAEEVKRRAQPLAVELRQSAAPQGLEERLLTFDQELKIEGVNPGTSADLTVASLFAAALESSHRCGRKT